MRAPAHGLLLVLLAGLLVHLPSAWWGFFADDYGHQIVLDGAARDTSMRPWSLYDFGRAPVPGESGYEDGAFPWWTDPDWEVRFLRPVASLSLMLDHAFYGGNPFGYHATGLLLFAAICAAAHALYRALALSAGTAFLAALILAVEDGTALPVGWVANRNAPVEALFVVLACLAVARPRQVGPGAVALALAAAAAAALSKESGVAAFALVALGLLARARAAGAEPDARERRIARAGAAAAVAGGAVYLAAFLALGYGARSLFYPTPWDAPAAVLAGAAWLVACAPLTLATPFAPDVLAQHPAVAAALLPLAAAIALALCAGAWALVRRAPRAGLCALAALIALAPQAGAPISDRLYLVPAVCAAPLLALAVERLLAGGRARRILGLALLGLLLPLSGLSCFLRSLGFVPVTQALRDVVLAAEVGAPEQGPRDALVLNAPSEIALLVPITTWRVETGDEGVRFFPLQMGRRAVAWTRVGERAFELEALDGPGLGAGQVERVFRTRSGIAPGERRSTARFQVEALEVDADGGVRRARFELDVPLEHPRLAFLAWRDGRLRRIDPPAIGERVTLSGPDPLFPLLP